MPTFIDKKHKTSVQLSTSDLVTHFYSMQSGATLPLPQYMEGFREIETLVGHRQPPRNTYLGTVITKPSNTCFLVGLSWTDHDDNDQSDEDLISFNEISPDTFEIERLRPSEIKHKFPAWDGYHHEDKDYLK